MPSYVVNVLRPKDLLHIQFEFVNMKLDTAVASKPRLVRVAAGQAFVVIRLPPQHVAEEAFARSASPAPPYRGFLACPSRLAFRLPDATGDIPFTIESMLELVRRLQPLIIDLPGDGSPATAIGLPDRLLLIPEPEARLFHRTIPKVSEADLISGAEWSAVWYTHVARGDSHGEIPVRFRAVSNPADRDEIPVEMTQLSAIARAPEEGRF